MIFLAAMGAAIVTGFVFGVLGAPPGVSGIAAVAAAGGTASFVRSQRSAS